MNTKLTLSLSKSVIEKARKYAKKSDTSISQLVENYLKFLTSNELPSIVEEPKERYSKLAKLRGVMKMPPDFNEKEERYKVLWEKYLKLK